MINSLCTVLHAQGGNIAEHLVASGLARVVDWHAGMLAAGGGMERLRQAERVAKEKRLRLYASAPAPSAKSNGTTVNGTARSFDAIVTRVWSGDQISVADRDTGKERRIQLSSTRAPKWVLCCILSCGMLNFVSGSPMPGKLTTHTKLANSCVRS